MSKIIRLLKNLKDWWPILVSDSQHDGEFIDDIMYHKLKLMQKWWDKKDIHTQSETDKLTRRDIDDLLTVFDRYISDDYLEIPSDKLPKQEFVSVGENGDGEASYVLKAHYHEDYPYEKLEELYKQCEVKKKDDRHYIYTVIRDKSCYWWD